MPRARTPAHTRAPPRAQLLNEARGVTAGGAGGPGDVSDGYWLPTLLAADGRAFPTGPMVAYLAYSAVVRQDISDKH